MNNEDSTKQLGTGINPQNMQEHLDSAQNALAKGQSQFFTPRWLGALCARALPPMRPFICDLNCGTGQLLYSAANKETHSLMGCDIDTVRSDKEKTDQLTISRIVGDVTKVYPLLVEANFTTDCFVLNPPWDLHWYRDRLKDLADSDDASVRFAFERHDGRVSRECIDSTVATLLIALDRMTNRGTGFLIGNEATLQRLIFKTKAPHEDIGNKIYAHVSIAGNPMTKIADSQFQKGEEFRTGIIWFGSSHYNGCQYTRHVESPSDLEAAIAGINLAQHLRGNYVYSAYHGSSEAPPTWGAVRQEWAVRQGEAKPEFNIWLDRDGRVMTYLTAFEKRSTKIDKGEIDRLHALQGQRPVQLVMQAQERAELNRAVNGGMWKVAPAVAEAVRCAVMEYDAIRAPLFPLNKIQRMGYLDEEKFIKCSADLVHGHTIAFTKGKSYELRSQSVNVERTRFKPSLSFGNDEFLLSGQELCFFITGNDGKEYSFVDARMTEEGVKVEIDELHFTMNILADHFEIPEVPDVSQTNPQGFALKLKALDEIERLMNV